MSITRNIGAFLSKVNNVKEQLFSPKNLFYTNVAISISLSAVGDILEQQYEILKEEWEEYSASRTRNMAVSGMTVGIICHHWYRYLDNRLPGRTIGLLEKSNWSDLKEEIKNKAHRLYIAEWIVWPPAQIINFYLLPSRFRVLYDNTISLGYDIYTSHVKYDNSKKELREKYSDTTLYSCKC